MMQTPTTMAAVTNGGVANLAAGGSPIRALETIYQNTSGKYLLIRVRASKVVAAASSFAMQLLSDNSNAPSAVADSETLYNDGAVNRTLLPRMWFLVAPGDYYQVHDVTGGGALLSWYEWTMG